MNLAKRVAEGVTAKLDYDYACNRGHSFGEHHLHGIVNEILCANVDPTKHGIHCGYAPVQLNKPGPGRKLEIDFAMLDRKARSVQLAAEVKWAGSSHCHVENVLKDLLRLQIIANSEVNAECFFLLSGRRDRIDQLFKRQLFNPGTRSLLTRPGEGKINSRRTVRKKNFPLIENAHHQKVLDNYKEQIADIVGANHLRYITTSFASPKLSAATDGRFHSFVWRVHPN